MARLYLSLNIHLLEGCSSSALKQSAGLACQKCYVILPVFKKMLTVIVDYELRSISIRLEAELLCDEAQIQVRFVTRDWLVEGLKENVEGGKFLTLCRCCREQPDAPEQ